LVVDLRRRRSSASGIGGIMGGQSSEITTEASRVLLEVGYFVPLAHRADALAGLRLRE